MEGRGDGVVVKTTHDPLALTQTHTHSTHAHPLPRAVAAATRAAAAAATALVQRGAVAEDEDWQLHPQPVPGDDGGEAEAGLSAIVAALAGGASGEELGLEGDPTDEERAALAARLTWRAATLALLHAARDADTAALATAIEAAGAALSRVHETAAAAATASTLDPAAARAVLPPTPPRPDRFLDRTAGLVAWRVTLDDLAGVASFGDAADAAGGGLRGSARALASYTSRRAGAVPRSALAMVLGLGLDVTGGGDADNGDAAVADPPTHPPLPLWAPSLASVAADTGMPFPDPPGAMATKFLEQALLGVQGFCVASLLNPARSRRRHKRCLEDWVHVHQHAANAEACVDYGDWLAGSGWRWDPPALPPPGAPPPPDAAVAEHASPLSAWVEEAACRAALAHIGAGWRLELYAHHEAPALLWHADYLGRRAEGAALALALRWPPQQVAKPRGRRAPPPPSPTPHAVTIYADACAHTLRRTVAGALMRAAAAVAARGGRSVAPSENAFNGGAERFTARFAALGGLTVPPPLAHADYVAAVEGASELCLGGEKRVVGWKQARRQTCFSSSPNTSRPIPLITLPQSPCTPPWTCSSLLKPRARGPSSRSPTWWLERRRAA